MTTMLPSSVPARGLCAAVLVLARAPAAAAQGDLPAADPALAISATAPSLAWGACPAFLPAGCELAVLHGDPAQPNADVFLKLPGGSSFPRHWHTSAERMVLVSGELRVTYDGQPEAVLRPGNYAYGPARRAHSGRCASVEPCVLFIAFEAPVDATVVEGAAGVDAAARDGDRG